MADQSFDEPADLSDYDVVEVATPIPMARTTPSQLGYAPPAKNPNRAIITLVAGVGSSVVALAGVYVLDRLLDTNLMGLYYGYVVPFGALLAGAVAASGYALSAWKLGLKIQHWYFAAVIALLVACFFAAKYVEFRAAGPFPQQIITITSGGAVKRIGVGRQSFLEHFHQETINWTWKDNKVHGYDYDRKPPVKMGGFGYFFQFLGIAGFCLGGALVPLALRAAPYCDLCEQYLTRTELALVPTEQADARLNRIKQAARRGDVSECHAALRSGVKGRKEVKALQRRTGFKLEFCKSCNAGSIKVTDFAGQGKQMKSSPRGVVSLDPLFLKRLRDELERTS